MTYMADEQRLSATLYFKRGTSYLLYETITPLVFSNIVNLTLTSYGDESSPKAIIQIKAASSKSNSNSNTSLVSLE